MVDNSWDFAIGKQLNITFDCLLSVAIVSFWSRKNRWSRVNLPAIFGSGLALVLSPASNIRISLLPPEHCSDPLALRLELAGDELSAGLRSWHLLMRARLVRSKLRLVGRWSFLEALALLTIILEVVLACCDAYFVEDHFQGCAYVHNIWFQTAAVVVGPISPALSTMLFVKELQDKFAECNGRLKFSMFSPSTVFSLFGSKRLTSAARCQPLGISRIPAQRGQHIVSTHKKPLELAQITSLCAFACTLYTTATTLGLYFATGLYLTIISLYKGNNAMSWILVAMANRAS